MTIKEIEEMTGMIRANIRYYEAEGLVEPERNKQNGYRIYSETDLQTLLKIRLLRTLDVPLEEIKHLQSGQAALSDVLDRHLAVIQEKQNLLSQSGEISRMMLKEGESFDSLDALRYLRILEDGESNALKQDVKPKLNLPWRRYWARCLDFAIYALVVDGIMEIFPRWTWLSGLLSLGTMLLIEPLFLHLFGTTPGKVIFGIRVLNPDEGKLSYGDALVRTWTVMWEGEAMRIPLVSLYFRYKSLTAAENDQILPWEWDSDLTFRDDKMWRYAVFFAMLFAVEGLTVWLAL